ncbi:type I-A CRISPR-associated protein Cas4/Csa1 [Desulfotomaculum nigrificans]|uniref:type I-A CRISPR-associated protein Cas4/Csa1 n=1 Tax=Desulfotomaculum nigrificans TaxID=1565 RepID=UPI0001FAE901|nr:type I-A CRISPR-associated protein Cas4/Csa1 [Desulfotomaculum nigrificans]
MYFLSDEEKKHLLKNYLPRSRQADTAEELRGWNWHQPPLLPPYETKLGAYEIAGAYCPSNRDLYLRRVQKIKSLPSLAMIRGYFLHDVLVKELSRAKKIIYHRGVPGYKEIFNDLEQGQDYKLPDQFQVNKKDKLYLEKEADIIAKFERQRLAAKIHDVLVKQPYIGEDSLVNLAVPVVLEQKLDGSFLGMSSHLSVDAYTFSEPMVMDLKFGEKRKFHRLQTTAYALAMEAVYEFPVNLGCIVYAKIKDDRLIIEKDIHIIDDELRQWFVEERDEKLRMIEEEIDPGVKECPDSCHIRQLCH